MLLKKNTWKSKILIKQSENSKTDTTKVCEKANDEIRASPSLINILEAVSRGC